MNIVIATEHFVADKGGAERYVWECARWLRERGDHDVRVLAAFAPHPSDGFPVVVNPAARGRRKLTALEHARWLARQIETASADVVLGFNHAHPADVLMLHGGVHVAFEKSNALSAPHAWGRCLKTWMYRLVPKYRRFRENERLQFADPDRLFVAVSPMVERDMRTYYPAVGERIRVIAPGMALQAPPSGTPPRREHSLLFVSHNFRLKGLHDLLHAVAWLKRRGRPFRLDVVGKGKIAPYREMCRRLGLGNDVVFHGACDNMSEFYAGAGALIHPSYYDSFGGVCVEAMRFGLPCVISRQCGVAGFVEGGGIVKIDMPCTTETLARAIGQALQAETRQAAHETNPSIAARFTLDCSFRSIEALCQEQAGRRRPE